MENNKIIKYKKINLIAGVKVSFAYGYYDYVLFASLLLEILRYSYCWQKLDKPYCYGNLGRKWLLIQQKHSQKLSQQKRKKHNIKT